jgi:hypothetical protein
MISQLLSRSWYQHTYLYTYQHTYVPTPYIHTYIPTYLLATPTQILYWEKKKIVQLFRYQHIYLINFFHLLLFPFHLFLHATTDFHNTISSKNIIIQHFPINNETNQHSYPPPPKCWFKFNKISRSDLSINNYVLFAQPPLLLLLLYFYDCCWTFQRKYRSCLIKIVHSLINILPPPQNVDQIYLLTVIHILI